MSTEIQKLVYLSISSQLYLSILKSPWNIWGKIIFYENIENTLNDHPFHYLQKTGILQSGMGLFSYLGNAILRFIECQGKFFDA